MKAMYAEASIYYTTADGKSRIQWRKGVFRTNAKSARTAIPAYAKSVYLHTPSVITEHMTMRTFCVLDPCDPCDRWILESDGSEDTARILAQCDQENAAAGREIPRASFLPPAKGTKSATSHYVDTVVW